MKQLSSQQWPNRKRKYLSIYVLYIEYVESMQIANLRTDVIGELKEECFNRKTWKPDKSFIHLKQNK